MNWTGERLENFVRGEVVAEHLHRYALASQLCQGKHVLDIASGAGYGSALLAAVAASVVGVDVSESAVKSAAAEYQRANLRFLLGSAQSIPVPDGSVDVVVSFETLEHLEEHDQMFSEIKRVLRTGGVLIISTPDRTVYSDLSGYRNPYHVKELTRGEFVDLVGRYFRNYQILVQRTLLGSVIVSQESRGIGDVFEGSFEKVERGEWNQAGPFLVAVASDQETPLVSSSMFDGTQMIASAHNKAVEDALASVTRGWSYRLGRFLLTVPIWIRNYRRRSAARGNVRD
jgi:ubiquinone/menaquinone biosynthesis C-methylase UbiE